MLTLSQYTCLQAGNNIMHLAVYRERPKLIKMILGSDSICVDALNNVCELCCCCVTMCVYSIYSMVCYDILQQTCHNLIFKA